MSANKFNPPLGNPPPPAQEPLPQAGPGAREPARQAGEQFKQKSIEAAGELKQKGTEALHEARHQAEELASRQKDHLLDTLSHCSHASRAAAESLRQDNDDTMAGLADALAGQIDRSTQYLRHRDYKGMLHDTGDLARRHPEVFFGGMLVAGLALARFLKASASHEPSREHWELGPSYSSEEYPRSAAVAREESSSVPSQGSSPAAGVPSVTSHPETQFTG